MTGSYVIVPIVGIQSRRHEVAMPHDHEPAFSEYVDVREALLDDGHASHIG